MTQLHIYQGPSELEWASGILEKKPVYFTHETVSGKVKLKALICSIAREEGPGMTLSFRGFIYDPTSDKLTYKISGIFNFWSSVDKGRITIEKE